MLRKALVASSILALSVSAHAENGYVGLSIGNTDLDLPGFDDGSSLAIYGGYRINRNLAVEASYIDFGDSSDNIAPVWTLNATGVTFSALGIAPVSENLDLFGKIGLLMWDATLDEAGTGQIATDEGNDFIYGLGASVSLAQGFGLAVEYQTFELDDIDGSNISFGVRYNF